MRSPIAEEHLPDYIYEVLWPRLSAARGAERGTGPGYSWAASPHPVWGQALWDLDPEKGITATGSTAAWAGSVAAKARELGTLVSTGPVSRARGAEGILSDSGFIRHRVTEGMVLGKDAFTPPAATRENNSDLLTIGEVKAEGDWLSWSRILCENLFRAEAPGAVEAFALACSSLAAAGKGFTAFLGKDASGAPLATSATLLCPGGTDDLDGTGPIGGIGGIGGIFYVAVDSAARRRGHGAAVTARACEAAFDSGCGIAALTATVDGAPVYAKLGFRKVSDIARWKAPEAPSR